jgi:hypothetical protein
MPFVERHESHPPGFFAEVLQQLLTPAATAAGFEVKTAIRQGSDVIQSTIVNDLLDADLVLADLTEHNPNVLFGIAAGSVDISYARRGRAGRMFRCPRSSLRSSSVMWSGLPVGVI